MNRFTIMSNRELRQKARTYNAEAARHEAYGTKSVWQPYAQWVEDILDQLECRIGVEATDIFRDKLAEDHAMMVALYEKEKAAAEAAETKLVSQ